MKTLLWVRREFRLHDNRALASIPEEATQLDIVFVWPEDFTDWGEYRQLFFIESLTKFQEDLKSLGQTLFIIDQPLSHWLKAPENIYQCLVMSKSFNSQEKSEEDQVLQFFENSTQRVVWCDQGTLLLEDSLPMTLEDFPRGFSQFRRKVEKGGLQIEDLVADVTQLIPSKRKAATQEWLQQRKPKITNNDFKGGEESALKRLQHYLWDTDGIQDYKETRNGMLVFDDSSKFSPWLALGCLSPRKIYWEIQSYEEDRVKNESTYWLIFELLWRDFFKFLAQHQGESFFTRSGLQNKSFEDESLEDLKKDFKNWCQGQTGHPFIDANMIELRTTGWMSNRGRQNVASFLAKIKQVNWTWGANWFEKQLIDYDPENNWGNWAYLAGVGVDPRDRVFNIDRQASVYDPQGLYQKKYLEKN
jgi:deoxyribodipyrimidine photo-lyase